MKEKKVIFRVGDTCKIIIPKVVRRVGYPKSIDEDYLPAAKVRFGPLIDQLFANEFGGNTVQREKIEREMAYLLAKKDKHGGPVRSVHLEEKPEWADATFFIYDMKSYREGVYVAGSRGSYGYDGYSEPEPPHLDSTGVVRCAIGRVSSNSPTIFKASDDMTRIPVAHLEKLDA